MSNDNTPTVNNTFTINVVIDSNDNECDKTFESPNKKLKFNDDFEKILEKFDETCKSQDEKFETNKIEDSIYDIKNLCVECEVDMGYCNPRQYCGKTYCLYNKYN